ncbi:C4-dicarboxylate TRAP transporter substrate-binding protein [Petrocella sp. FN5]|uniref:C4-dicarboxylate TRAP transporter substrate-binding protein n=1 Tax=Petrocella sp. FN5 TaxID=3032002 RepID=UPI0023D9E11B|nr:C4-dicarboxylate TRAP transporter substrate-binding protein [Petrocella sp. FN5]MDF1618567.1 C4-dicarboxylate TRAP transporter substrate-binding protein [Petrocella sp. FN5]
MKKEMMKLLSLCFVLAIGIGLFAGCAKEAPIAVSTNTETEAETEVAESDVDDDYKLVLKLSHVFSPDEQLTKSMDAAAAKILEKTNGAIEIQTFPQGQIATYKDGVEQVVRGADFISVEDPSYIGDYVPEFTALVGPMLYNNYDEYRELVRTEMVQEWTKKAEEKGIKILALDFIFGFRNVITDKVVVTPEDLKGVKLRTPGSQLFIETLNAMGATSTPLPWGETFSALEQGIVDGLEGSEFTNINTKVYETGKKNVALTNHFLGTCGVYISLDVWNSIPEKYRIIMQEEFDAEADYSVELLKSQHADVVKELESYGVEFNEVDVAAFTEATKGLYETLPGLNIEIYNQIQAELAEIRGN